MVGNINREAIMNFIIPSRQMREYLSEVNHKFSDFELATLVYYAKKYWGERESKLIDLCKITTDDILKNQINESLLYHQKCYECFLINKCNHFVYILDMKTDTSYREGIGYFGTIEMAHKCARTYICSEEEIADYCIRKELLIQDDKTLEMYYEKYGNAIVEAGTICGKKVEEIGIEEVHAVSQYTFDREGNMKDGYSYELPKEERIDDWNNERFENATVFIPHPFQVGDQVKCHGLSGKLTVVKIKKYYSESIGNLNWLDMESIICDLEDNHGEKRYVYINPIYLEAYTTCDVL